MADNHPEILKTFMFCARVAMEHRNYGCLPCWFLWCIGLATLSPICDNAPRKKPFRSNK